MRSVKTRALEIEISSDNSYENHAHHSCQRPADNPLPGHGYPLKSLSHRDVVLRPVNARHGVQVASEVDAYRANRRRITQSDSDGVRVVVGEVAHVDRVVHVSAV